MKATYILPCILSLNALFKVLYPALQHIVSVGVGHASKSVCSGVFLSNRTSESVMENEMQGITAMLIIPRVNYTDQTVSSSFFGLSKKISDAMSLRVGVAKYLGPSFGCSMTMETYKISSEFYNDTMMKELIQYDNDTISSTSTSTSSSTSTSTSGSTTCSTDTLGNDETTSGTCKDIEESYEFPKHLNIECFNSVLESDFSDEALKRNQSRAIVISHDSRIVAERYQEQLGINHNTKLLGWSMTKSIFSAIVGVAIEHGLVTLDSPAKLEHLKEAQREKLIEANNGSAITFRQLLQMYDVLGFVEDYGPMKDVVFMLYGTYETVKFSSSRQIFADPNRQRGEGWYYSSAVSNLLSAELRSLFNSDVEYWEFPHKHLFAKIGAHSFAVEMDARGLYVASSFGYATARDWTKMGELLLNNGQYNGEQIINREFLEFATKPHPLSGGHYGAQLWLNPACATAAEDEKLPAEHPIRKKNSWLKEAVPSDAYFMSGHDGQSVFVLPSQKLVITRLGFTKDADDKKYTHSLMESLMTCVSKP